MYSIAHSYNPTQPQEPPGTLTFPQDPDHSRAGFLPCEPPTAMNSVPPEKVQATLSYTRVTVQRS